MYTLFFLCKQMLGFDNLLTPKSVIICQSEELFKSLMKSSINFSGFAEGRRRQKGRRRRRKKEKKCNRRRGKNNCWKQLSFHQDLEHWETRVCSDERCKGDAGRHIRGINWEGKTLLVGRGRRGEKYGVEKRHRLDKRDQ